MPTCEGCRVRARRRARSPRWQDERAPVGAAILHDFLIVPILGNHFSQRFFLVLA